MVLKVKKIRIIVKKSKCTVVRTGIKSAAAPTPKAIPIVLSVLLPETLKISNNLLPIVIAI
jgi:hypothetical protein